jgi:hypothetical protein
MEPKQQLALNGQELQTGDFNNVAAEAALADDRVFAELLRLAPYTGSTYAKVVMPYGGTGTSTNSAFVRPNGSSGSIKVMPFRAVVGPRVLVTSADGSANWRDIRSKVFAASSDSSTLGYALSIAANSSGADRIDLVYATVTVDVNLSSQPRYQKDPSTKVVSQQNVVTQVDTQVAVFVATGTASPAALPADNALFGLFYIPLAYIYVPNGFGPSSAVTTDRIQIVAPFAALSGRASGAATMAPARRMYTDASFVADRTSYGGRQGYYLPSSMVGWHGRMIQLDNLLAPNSSVVDDTIDWRYRQFLTFAVARTGSSVIASDPVAGSNLGILVPQVGLTPSVFMGQSMHDDSSTVSGAVTSTGAVVAVVTVGGHSGTLYVDMTDGALKWHHGTIVTGDQTKIVFHVFASGQFDNL